MGLLKDVKDRFSFTWIVVGVFLIFLIYAMVKEKPASNGSTANSEKGQMPANSATQQDAKLDADQAKLTAKLKSTTIGPDDISKDEDSLPAILARLAEIAKKSDPRGKGINIVFIPDRRPAKPAEPRGKNPSLDIDADDTGAEQTIVCPFDNVTLSDTLQNLCLAANYKYRVEDHAVVVAPAEAALDFMVTKVFTLGEEDKWRKVKKKGGLKKWLRARGIEFPLGARLIVMRDLGLVVVRNTPGECAKIRKALTNGKLLVPGKSNARVTLMEVDIPEREYRAACVNGLPPRDDFWRRAIATGKAKVVAMGQTLSSSNESCIVRMTNEAYFPEDWCDAAADQAPPPVPDDDKTKEKGDDMPPRVTRTAPLHVIAPEFGESSDRGTSFESTTARSNNNPSCMTVEGYFTNNLFVGWEQYGQTAKMPVFKTSRTDCSSVLAPARMKVIESSVREERGPSEMERARRVSLLVATPINALKSNADPTPWRPRTNAERALAKIPVTKFQCDKTPLAKVIRKLRDIVKKHHDAPSISMWSRSAVPDKITSKIISLDLTGVSAYDVLRYACLQAGLEFHTANGAILVLDPNEKVDDDDETPFKVNYTPLFDEVVKTFTKHIRKYHRVDPQMLVECSIVRMGQKDLEALVGAKTARLGGFSEKQLQQILTKGHLEMSLSCVTNLSEGKEKAQVLEKYLPECWDDVTYTTDSDGKIHVIPPIPEFGAPYDIGGRINVSTNAGFDDYNAVRLDLNFVSQRMTGKIDYELRAAPGSPADWQGKIWMPILTQMKYEGTLTIQNGQTVLAGWLKTKALPSGGKLTDETSNARNGLENIFFLTKVGVVAPNGKRYPSLEEMLRRSLDAVGLR